MFFGAHSSLPRGAWGVFGEGGRCQLEPLGVTSKPLAVSVGQALGSAPCWNCPVGLVSH